MLLLVVPVWPLHAEETNIVQFKVSAPYSSEEEIGRRFGFRPPFPPYDIVSEKFRLTVPASYSTNSAWGLVVWLSPGEDGSITPDWQDELGKHKILIVAPLNAGDERHPLDRLRLALDATSNVCRRYRIDRKRIYVAGFSAGARMASMIGIACGDIFTGMLCVSGINFHMNVPASGGQYFPASFYPSADILYFARTHAKYVLMVGEKDPDRDLIRLVAERGFVRDGFKNVLFIEVPGLQRALPGISPLDQALTFLDAPLPRDPAAGQ